MKASNLYRKFSNLLKAYIIESGQSAVWLATELRVNQSVMVNWTKGKTAPSLEQALIICDTLSLSDADGKALLMSLTEGVEFKGHARLKSIIAGDKPKFWGATPSKVEDSDIE